MREPLFDPKASKQTISLSMNSDLYAKAKGLGVNVSKVAEEALAYRYAELRKADLLDELRRDLATVGRDGAGTRGGVNRRSLSLAEDSIASARNELLAAVDYLFFTRCSRGNALPLQDCGHRQRSDKM